jgi:hypothetical protein
LGVDQCGFDGDIISYLILGVYDHAEGKYVPVDVFTCDSKVHITDRLNLHYFHIKRFFEQQAMDERKTSALSINLGTIYFVSDDCTVLEKKAVHELLNINNNIALEVAHN